MPDSPEDQPIADLIGHELEISTRCSCTKVTVFGPAYLVERLGKSATLRMAAARLICRTCGQRPVLSVKRTWGTSGGRDRRRDPPALPGWVAVILQD